MHFWTWTPDKFTRQLPSSQNTWLRTAWYASQELWCRKQSSPSYDHSTRHCTPILIWQMTPYLSPTWLCSCRLRNWSWWTLTSRGFLIWTHGSNGWKIWVRFIDSINHLLIIKRIWRGLSIYKQSNLFVWDIKCINIKIGIHFGFDNFLTKLNGKYAIRFNFWRYAARCNWQTRTAGCCASSTECSDHIHLKKKQKKVFFFNLFFKLMSFLVDGVIRELYDRVEN